MPLDAVTPADVTGLFRNVIRNASLFSTMSTKRKSRPNAPLVSGTALMNRRPAVGTAGVSVDSAGIQALTRPPTRHSTERSRIRRMQVLRGSKAAGERFRAVEVAECDSCPLE